MILIRVTGWIFTLSAIRVRLPTLAENFREYPGFVLQKWKLALECRGLILGNEVVTSKSPPITINVSTLPPQEVTDASSAINEQIEEPTTFLLTLVKDPSNLCQDMTDWMPALIDKKKWKNAIPVFSANKCRNPLDSLTSIFRPIMRKSTGGRISPRPPKATPGLLGFAVIDTASNQHGTFDLANGKFTDKTAGVFLFHFSGYYLTNTYKPIPDSASVQLRVNGFPVARSASRVPVTADAKKSNNEEDDDDDDEDKPSHSVTVSSFLRLETGDVVDCFSDELYLNEEEEPYDYHSDKDEVTIKSEHQQDHLSISHLLFPR